MAHILLSRIISIAPGHEANQASRAMHD